PAQFKVGESHPKPKPPVETWTHSSGDVNLIHNLVLSECGSDTVEASSVADVVIGVKGRAPISNSGNTFKPMIFGFSEGSESTNSEKAPQFSAQGFNPPPSTAPLSQSQLAGDLRDMPVPGLLQSCGLNKMTGCLHIVGDHG